jgi:chromosomal replication initiator protein
MMDIKQDNSLWLAIKEELRRKLGEAIYSSWIAGLGFDGIQNGQVVLTAPSRFIREWFINNYQEITRELFCVGNSSIYGIEVVVRQSAIDEAPAFNASSANENIANKQDISLLDSMGAALDPRYFYMAG